jgi:excisionase family DNA binding protein
MAKTLQRAAPSAIPDVEQPERRPIEREAFGIPEVAERLGISRRTVYSMIEAGRLRSVHLGTRRLVLRSDLEAFLAALRSEAA